MSEAEICLKALIDFKDDEEKFAEFANSCIYLSEPDEEPAPIEICHQFINLMLESPAAILGYCLRLFQHESDVKHLKDYVPVLIERVSKIPRNPGMGSLIRIIYTNGQKELLRGLFAAGWENLQKENLPEERRDLTRKMLEFLPSFELEKLGEFHARNLYSAGVREEIDENMRLVIDGYFGKK